jgi:hypothetical protein
VDDTEDGEVIVHEYSHTVHDAQVARFVGSLEAGSIGEAFGDYLDHQRPVWLCTQHQLCGGSEDRSNCPKHVWQPVYKSGKSGVGSSGPSLGAIPGTLKVYGFCANR